MDFLKFFLAFTLIRGYTSFLAQAKLNSEKRDALIERAKTQEGIYVRAVGGIAYAGKIAIDVETFEALLDRLSNAK